jgi:hypothetical protein
MLALELTWERLLVLLAVVSLPVRIDRLPKQGLKNIPKL